MANVDRENNSRLVKETKHLLADVTAFRKLANVNCQRVMFPDPENYDEPWHEIVRNNDASHKTENDISIEEMNENLRELKESLEVTTIPWLGDLAGIPK